MKTYGGSTSWPHGLLRRRNPATLRWLRFFLAVVVALFLGVVEPRLAAAMEIWGNDGDITGFLDTTLTMGAAVRAADRNPNIIGQTNGGRAFSVNADDGNLNWGQWDVTSLSARITHELVLDWRNFGFFGRVNYFYDTAVMDIGTDRTHLTHTARRRAGWDVNLLDYYLTGDFEVAERSVTVRFGSQVLNWGESTFIQNGINAINPVDVTQLRVAGAELRDALIPIPAIDVVVGITDQLSIEGFYQFYWDHTEIEPLGTYFSTTDIASPGANHAMLGFGQPGYEDNPPKVQRIPFGASVPRVGDNHADSQGEGGIAIRYFSPQLNDAELGLYWLHYHSRLPLLSGFSGREDQMVPFPTGLYANSGKYFREFPEDIDLVGLSFNTEIFPSLAMQGEVSYKFDQPLQVDDVELLFAALGPAAPRIFGESQLGLYGWEEYVRGYRRHDVLQAQTTMTHLMGPTLGSDQLVFLGEVGATWIQGMQDKDRLRYEAPGTFTSANDFFTTSTPRIQPGTENGIAFANRFSWGYRLVVRADFLGAIGSVNLFPIAAFEHDVEGTTPSPILNFVDDRKSATARLDAAYLASWRASLAYTNYFDGGRYNLLSDRDFISLNLSYSF